MWNILNINIMAIFEETIGKVEMGARFYVNFKERSLRVNGKYVIKDGKPLNDKEFGFITDGEPMEYIYHAYKLYKHSVPSKRSNGHRRSYFKALAEKDLSDDDMMYGEGREMARCRLELAILIMACTGQLVWNPEWGNVFYQDDDDKDLVIMREWVEPQPESNAA